MKTYMDGGPYPGEDKYPVDIFTVEVCIRDVGDGLEAARAQLAARLTLGTRVTYTEVSHRRVIPGEWRENAREERERAIRWDDTALVEGERYELVHAEDLKPGDQIYMMARRRTVTEKPWHPAEMRPELLRVPMSDRPGGRTIMGPPFEKDHLVPRLVRDLP